MDAKSRILIDETALPDMNVSPQAVSPEKTFLVLKRELTSGSKFGLPEG